MPFTADIGVSGFSEHCVIFLSCSLASFVALLFPFSHQNIAKNYSLVWTDKRLGLGYTRDEEKLLATLKIAENSVCHRSFSLLPDKQAIPRMASFDTKHELLSVNYSCSLGSEESENVHKWHKYNEQCLNLNTFRTQTHGITDAVASSSPQGTQNCYLCDFPLILYYLVIFTSSVLEEMLGKSAYELWISYELTVKHSLDFLRDPT